MNEIGMPVKLPGNRDPLVDIVAAAMAFRPVIRISTGKPADCTAHRLADCNGQAAAVLTLPPSGPCGCC
jgi:hypothetical protein